MVVAFTVHPCCGGFSLLSDKVNRYGPLAHMMSDLSGWSDCYRKYPSVVAPTRLSCGEGGGDDAVDDYVFGRDCVLDDLEWARFCVEVLLLDAPVPQTLDAIVDVVDEMVVFIVRAVAGCSEFSSSHESRLMQLVVVLVRFLLLCGGSSVFPREYALARFGGVEYAEDAEDGARRLGPGGRAFAYKMMRRLVSLGRCVRGLLRVAWENAMWRDPALFRLLCLDCSKDHRFCDVWRAAFGLESKMAQFMGGMIGPSYSVCDPACGGYEDHEYDETSWRLELAHNPMSSETVLGSALHSLVVQGGSYVGFGGSDRQVKIFLHNMHWIFMHGGRYRGMSADRSQVRDFLPTFGIEVGGGVNGVGPSGEFRVVGVRTWRFGWNDGLGLFGEDAGDVVVSSFFAALDGSIDVVDCESDGRCRLRDADVEAAREVVTNFARLRGWDGDVMDLIASVSIEELVGSGAAS